MAALDQHARQLVALRARPRDENAHGASPTPAHPGNRESAAYGRGVPESGLTSDLRRCPSSSRESRQLGGEGGRVVAGASLDPRSVLRGDDGGQSHAVVMRGRSARGSRHRAAPRSDAPLPRRRACPRRPPPLSPSSPVRTAARSLPARPRARPARGRSGARSRYRARAGRACTQPARRVQAAFTALAQARVDVPAQRLDRERGLEREQLRAMPRRARQCRCACPRAGTSIRASMGSRRSSRRV